MSLPIREFLAEYTLQRRKELSDKSNNENDIVSGAETCVEREASSPSASPSSFKSLTSLSALRSSSSSNLSPAAATTAYHSPASNRNNNHTKSHNSTTIITTIRSLSSTSTRGANHRHSPLSPPTPSSQFPSSFCKRRGSLLLTVTDDGAGMTPEQLKTVCSEGVQFNANQLQAGQGSGLGLFIVKGEKCKCNPERYSYTFTFLCCYCISLHFG